MFTSFDFMKTFTEAKDQQVVMVGGWLQVMQAMTIAMYAWAAFGVALTLATLVNIIKVLA